MGALAWADLEREAPEIAAVGGRLFARHEVAYLATVSRDGRPRVHPFCPAIAEGLDPETVRRHPYWRV